MINKDKEKSKPGPGPKEERVKVEGDWEDATKKAIKKKRPEKRWPSYKESENRDKS